MYKIENKEEYKVIHNEKGVVATLNSYEEMLEYIYNKEYNDRSYRREMFSDRVSNIINYSGKDSYYKAEPYQTVNGWRSYNYIKSIRPYMIVDSYDRSINAGEFIRRYVKFKAEQDRRRQIIDSWYEAYKPEYKGWYHSFWSKERMYEASKRKEKENFYIPDRGTPVPHVHGFRCRKYYRRPKLKNKMLSNIDYETGEYYKSSYRPVNMPVWDDRARHIDKCWKSQKKCKKQWMKHLNASELNYDKMRLDPEDIEIAE